MLVKRYGDVEPGQYEGMREGVVMREMITALDGAPHFALRVFDLAPGASTPYHSHDWEHEVFILKGAGKVRSEQGDRPFAAGDAVFVLPNEKHCFVADASQAIQFVCVIPTKNQCSL